MRHFPLIPTIVLFFLCSTFADDIAVTGRVVGKDTGPMAGVIVRLAKNGMVDTTNGDGYYGLGSQTAIASIRQARKAGCGRLTAGMLSFSVASPSLVPVRACVYDLSGKLLADLLNEFLPGGDYSIPVHIAGTLLSSRMYIVRLQIGGSVSIHRFMNVGIRGQGSSGGQSHAAVAPTAALARSAAEMAVDTVIFIRDGQVITRLPLFQKQGDLGELIVEKRTVEACIGGSLDLVDSVECLLFPAGQPANSPSRVSLWCADGKATGTLYFPYAFEPRLHRVQVRTYTSQGVVFGQSTELTFGTQAAYVEIPCFNVGLYALPTPANLEAMVREPMALVRWDAVPGAEGYYVYRRLGKTTSGTCKLLGTTSTPSFMDMAPDRYRTNQYMVQAYAGNALSMSSLPVSINLTSPIDSTLKVDLLSDLQELEFSATDGILSQFWSTWMSHDSLFLVPAGHSYPGRELHGGPEDASMVVKAAAGTKGLYLMVEVTDDVWNTAVEGAEAWQFDALDIYLDSRSSEELTTGGDSIMINPAYGWAMSYTTQQLQFWMNENDSLPSAFMFNYYDDLYWCSSFNKIRFDQCPLLYNGMGVEAVSVAPNRRAIELFIPWKWVGVGGVGLPLEAGRKFAFTVGYNDRDSDTDSVGCLRWLRFDPFAGSQVESPGISETALESWGDLELTAAVEPSTGQNR